MNYHNLIWMSIGLGVVVGVLTVGVMIYTIFFEDKDGTDR